MTIPITIVTGFLGSGKTTLILNLIPQLPAEYKLALLKNEFGDVAVDSQLANSKSISGVRELLNGCICCNLVGQLSDALLQLRDEVSPDRIVIETSGSAFPATLAMEVNRLARETESFSLDGVISVIDVENWKGYEDTSYTAKMQARYTDLLVFNKWEDAGERRFDEVLDRVGDLDLQIPWVKSNKGRVDLDVVIGIDGALISKGAQQTHESKHEHESGSHDHHSEVEVLRISIEGDWVDIDKLEALLLKAPRDEVYRIKGLVRTEKPPVNSTGEKGTVSGIYALNWAFSRWTYTLLPDAKLEEAAALTMILARYESGKWKKKLESSDIAPDKLSVTRIS